MLAAFRTAEGGEEMKAIAILAAAAALVTLAGCDRLGIGGGTANNVAPMPRPAMRPPAARRPAATPRRRAADAGKHPAGAATPAAASRGRRSTAPS